MKEGVASTAAPERCTRPCAPTAARNVKSRSSPQRAAQSTAVNATRTTGHRDTDRLASGS